MRLFYTLLLTALSATFLSAQSNDGPDDPAAPPYNRLYQQYQERLTGLGKPVGRAGNSPYVPGQYVLRYLGPDGETDFRKDFDAIERQVGKGNVTLLGECGCTDEYRLYLLGFSGIGGEERGKRGKEEVAAMVGQEETQPNYYVIPGLSELADHAAFNELPSAFTVIPAGSKDAPVKIALLDSGIDALYQDAASTPGSAALSLWENKEDPGKDPFCLDDDIFGWDFVNDDNAPLDDHGHGTHVASRIAELLRRNAPGVNFQFMSLKILDEDGAGTTFSASCAALYAAHHGANVINASWGMYGEEDAIMRWAFTKAVAAGATILTSAGNERLNLARVDHYPSNYAYTGMPAVASIAAARANASLWPGTNVYIHPTLPAGRPHFIASPGFNLRGYAPLHFKIKGNMVKKTGTSIAVPMATAMVADYLSRNPGSDPAAALRAMRAAIEKGGTLKTFNFNGTPASFLAFKWLSIPK